MVAGSGTGDTVSETKSNPGYAEPGPAVTTGANSKKLRPVITAVAVKEKEYCSQPAVTLVVWPRKPKYSV